MSKKFPRYESDRYIKLGKKRKSSSWRRPTGRHNKVRKHRFGYPVMPAIGYKKPGKISGKILGLTPLLAHNVKELERIGANSIAIIAKVGAKKKIEIVKKAQELGIKIANINAGGGHGAG